jgi:spore germination cell wall hydrolase CwlJ-like protein
VAQKIAAEVTTGRGRVKEVARATHYHASYVAPKWAPAMRRLAKIGTHVFYRGV